MADDSGKKPPRIYFYPIMDIMLIMEVLQRNPYKNGNGVFASIAAELRKSDQFHDVQPRALQERTERLLKFFQNSQMHRMKRSGSEEEYDERERLLQDLSDLEKEWAGTLKRAATPPPTASEVRKKAARLQAMGKAVRDKIEAQLPPNSSTTAELELNNDRAQVQVVQFEEEPGEDNFDQGDLAGLDKPAKPQPRKIVGSAAVWTSTMDYMRERLEKEEENQKQRFDIQREELLLKKEELEVRKLEAANERLRIEAQQKENQRSAEMEERRRQDEREERNLMMERQNNLMDAMLHLIRSVKD